MKKLFCIITALVMVGMLSSCGAVDENKLVPDDFNVYLDEEKVFEIKEADENFFSFENSKVKGIRSDAPFETKRGVCIGDSIEMLAEKYDGNEVHFVTQKDNEEEEIEVIIYDSFSDYQAVGEPLQSGLITMEVYFIGGKPLYDKEKLEEIKALPEGKKPKNSFRNQIGFSIEDGKISSISTFYFTVK